MSLSVNPHVKTAAKVAGAAAAIGGAAYLVKSGKLAQAKALVADKIQLAAKGNPNVSAATDKAAAFAEKAQTKFAPVAEKASEFAGKAQTKLAPLAEKAAKLAAPVKEFAHKVATKASDVFSTTVGKYNPDLANAASKSAETFNNFVK